MGPQPSPLALTEDVINDRSLPASLLVEPEQLRRGEHQRLVGHEDSVEHEAALRGDPLPEHLVGHPTQQRVVGDLVGEPHVREAQVQAFERDNVERVNCASTGPTRSDRSRTSGARSMVR